MRWYNKLRLVFRIYSRRMFVTLLLFGMCFVSFFMIDRVFTGYIGSRYAIRDADRERMAVKIIRTEWVRKPLS